MVFFYKNILIPNVTEKYILILLEGKKSDSEFLAYNLMLNSGERKKYFNSRVVQKKKILNETNKP
jgi:hypothetical protein